MGEIRIPYDFYRLPEVAILEGKEDGFYITRVLLQLMVMSNMNTKTGLYEIRKKEILLTDNAFGIYVGGGEPRTANALKAIEETGIIKREPCCITIIPFWLDRHDRASLRYKTWRKQVFERDGYTCQHCGAKADLQAHHIIPWADTKDRKELRYYVENGITLCRRCHMKAHGRRCRDER